MLENIYKQKIEKIVDDEIKLRLLELEDSNKYLGDTYETLENVEDELLDVIAEDFGYEIAEIICEVVYDKLSPKALGKEEE